MFKVSPPLVIWAIFDGSFRSVYWGLKYLPPYVGVGSFNWDSKCLPPHVGIGLFDLRLKCLPLYVGVW